MMVSVMNNKNTEPAKKQAPVSQKKEKRHSDETDSQRL